MTTASCRVFLSFLTMWIMPVRRSFRVAGDTWKCLDEIHEYLVEDTTMDQILRNVDFLRHFYDWGCEKKQKKSPSSDNLT